MRAFRHLVSRALLLALLAPASLEAAEGKYLGGGWFCKVFWNGGETVIKVPNREIGGKGDGTSPIRAVTDAARGLMTRRSVWGIEVLRRGGATVPETSLRADGNIEQKYVPPDETLSVGRLPLRMMLRGARIIGGEMLKARRMLRAADDGSIESQVVVDPGPLNFRFVVRDGQIADYTWYDPIVPVPARVFTRLLIESAAHAITGWKPKGVWDTADISVKRLIHSPPRERNSAGYRSR